MPVFEFNVTTSSRNFGSQTYSGTLGTSGINFTLSVTAPFSSFGATDIGISGSTLSFITSTSTSMVVNTMFGSTTFGSPTTMFTTMTNFNSTIITVPVPASWSAVFSFTDPGDFFQGFQLNTSGVGATNLNIADTAGGTTNVLPGANVIGNVVRFTLSGFGGFANTLDSITANSIACFCAGTRIATPDGPVTVEELRAGDLVTLADGRTAPVEWLGQQTINAAVLHPAKVNPIRISAGALGQGLPERDLLVSPDHGIALDGYLVNAAALVNGSTIRRTTNRHAEGFTYYHVETAAHELILAEGVPAESYLDTPNRETFDNGAERADADRIQEMPLPRVSAARMLPRKIAEALKAPPKAA